MLELIVHIGKLFYAYVWFILLTKYIRSVPIAMAYCITDDDI